MDTSRWTTSSRVHSWAVGRVAGVREWPPGSGRGQVGDGGRAPIPTSRDPRVCWPGWATEAAGGRATHRRWPGARPGSPGSPGPPRAAGWSEGWAPGAGGPAAPTAAGRTPGSGSPGQGWGCGQGPAHSPWALPGAPVTGLCRDSPGRVTLGADSSVGWGHPVHCGMFHSVPVHCDNLQVSRCFWEPRGICPGLRTTGLGGGRAVPASEATAQAPGLPLALKAPQTTRGWPACWGPAQPSHLGQSRPWERALLRVLWSRGCPLLALSHSAPTGPPCGTGTQRPPGGCSCRCRRRPAAAPPRPPPWPPRRPPAGSAGLRPPGPCGGGVGVAEPGTPTGLPCPGRMHTPEQGPRPA